VAPSLSRGRSASRSPDRPAFAVTTLGSALLGLTHRRGGYRDPESQAFIESWFRYLKERCVWRHEFETLDQAREVIAAYIDHYHDRPHSRLDYRTPRELRATWDDAQ
jgi:putative transposase